MVFDVINVIIMLLLLVVTLYPFYYVILHSFNKGLDILENGGLVWTVRDFTLENYEQIFSDPELYISILVTVAQTVIATAGHLIFTGIFAYGYMQQRLKGKKLYQGICMLTMFVSGGMIPTYVVLLKLGFNANFLVYVIPTLFSYWDVLVMRLFFLGISDSIIEAARLDGASEYRIFFLFVAPLALPVFAALGTFFAIGKWNGYFVSMLYMSDAPELRTFQHILMDMIRSWDQSGADLIGGKLSTITKESVQNAAIVVSIIPIILIFPFMQKYMAAGIMTGSVKE